MVENELITSRNMELYEAYRNAFRSPEIRSHQQAIEQATQSPSSRYWISTLQACRYIIRLKKGIPIKSVNELKKKMILSIFEVYKTLERKPEFKGCSTYFITSFAIQKAAPEFYISYHRALAIISKMNRERRHNEQ